MAAICTDSSLSTPRCTRGSNQHSAGPAEVLLVSVAEPHDEELTRVRHVVRHGPDFPPGSPDPARTDHDPDLARPFGDEYPLTLFDGVEEHGAASVVYVGIEGGRGCRRGRGGQGHVGSRLVARRGPSGAPRQRRRGLLQRLGGRGAGRRGSPTGGWGVPAARLHGVLHGAGFLAVFVALTHGLHVGMRSTWSRYGGWGGRHCTLAEPQEEWRWSGSSFTRRTGPRAPRRTTVPPRHGPRDGHRGAGFATDRAHELLQAHVRRGVAIYRQDHIAGEQPCLARGAGGQEAVDRDLASVVDGDLHTQAAPRGFGGSRCRPRRPRPGWGTTGTGSLIVRSSPSWRIAMSRAGLGHDVHVHDAVLIREGHVPAPLDPASPRPGHRTAAG